jgi:hypothetical protein
MLPVSCRQKAGAEHDCQLCTALQEEEEVEEEEEYEEEGGEPAEEEVWPGTLSAHAAPLRKLRFCMSAVLLLLHCTLLIAGCGLCTYTTPLGQQEGLF